MALIANREARHYTANYLTNTGADAHGNARLASKRVIFRPGVNNVDDRDWRELKKNDGVLGRIRSGMLEVLEENGEDEAAADEPKTPPERIRESLAELRGAEARALIRETISVDALEAWLEVEKRKGVREALETQLEKVTKDSNEKPTRGGG